MLIFVLHVLVQDVVQSGRLDSVKQLLESNLLFERDDFAASIMRGRGEGEGQECKKYTAEEEVLDS
jgi:hypothetical protein